MAFNVNPKSAYNKYLVRALNSSKTGLNIAGTIAKTTGNVFDSFLGTTGTKIRNHVNSLQQAQKIAPNPLLQKRIEKYQQMGRLADKNTARTRTLVGGAVATGVGVHAYNRAQGAQNDATVDPYAAYGGYPY